ncbi:hypothetical protein JX266_001549 [Neoarthrinium moseri]|nr:hypothetical protein JX266_001549 [Neoarthrinium moseri]
MLRGYAKSGSQKKVVRGSGASITTIRKRNESPVLQSKPPRSRAIVSRQTADEPGGNGVGICLFLEKLPLELRLQIYETLLCSPDVIAISAHRRQQPTEGARCSWCNHMHRCDMVAPWRPHVTLLRTCRQINAEATTVLYQKNDFLVSVLVYQTYQPTNDFLWHLRQSTLVQIRHMRFRAGCRCMDWVSGERQEWQTDGRALSRTCFPHCVLSSLRPSPSRARETHRLIRWHVLDDKRTYCNPCRWCRAVFGEVF